MKHLKSFNENIKSESEFTEYMDKIFPAGLKDAQREGMLKGYDFLMKWVNHSKLNKIGYLAHERLAEYMHKIYPNDDQLSEREGMLKAYYFLSGQYDSDERQREVIRKKISDKMKKNGY